MSTEPISTRHQCELVGRLRQLVQGSSERAQQIEADYASGTQVCTEQYRSQQDEVSTRFSWENGELENEYSWLLTEERRQHETDMDRLAEEEVALAEETMRTYKKAVSDAKYDRLLACRRCKGELKTERHAAIAAYRPLWRTYGQHIENVQEIADRVDQTAGRRGCPSPSEYREAPPPSENPAGSVEQCESRCRRVQETLARLRHRPAARFVDRGGVFVLFLLSLLPFLIPAGLIWGFDNPFSLVATFMASLTLAFATHRLCRRLARIQTENAIPGMCEALVEARQSIVQARREDERHVRRKLADLKLQKERKLAELAEELKAKLDQLQSENETTQRSIAERFEKCRAETTQEWNERVRSLQAEYVPRIESGRQCYELMSEQIRVRHQKGMSDLEREYVDNWRSLASEWKLGLGDFQHAVDGMNEYCDRQFADLDRVDWETWQPSADALPALRFGSCTVDLSRFGVELSTDQRLQTDRSEFRLPAVLSYPDAPGLLLKASGNGRIAAVGVMQNVILRMLTSLPAGKVRLTIMDPTGLGENFSAFMHLADFDKRLVTSRIWTEATHINQRLADLTEHMENVIQKYLRNEFNSIQEYNEYAGEIAEPFHVLAVANFPNNFSDEAARRLISIASSGPKCGVYTLVSVDAKMKLPRNFDLTDLETYANTLEWDGEAFRWQHDELADFALRPESPPDENVFTSALRRVGQYAKEASRVEVPFTAAEPQSGQWWTKDSRHGIEVPLGRVGAAKLQHLSLGKGTAQHVLIAGKTGSGKSTLLHALITNLALHYPPDQVQFFLIDFKKGVEFKPYAEFALPHARVVAIESEREFGMSVLERLDVELRRRGDLFRNCGVQNLAGYRDARPHEAMPRLMLVIDEFQEFFVKDDRISQNASLLLDRLVRQGRAFGIHVLLGSQTLAGTYTLSRSTLGQMAVRIALQCSSADAHLILSEENDAARLLHRPGEAIYNDANGLFEGNHPFQVVWLPDNEKETYLHQLNDLAIRQGVKVNRPVVFEGNAPADPSENLLLHKAMRAPAPRETPLAPRAWLGEAIAITNPPAVVFHRRSGSNLLVGQRDEAALGILANCLLGVTAFSPVDETDQTRFYVLDGMGPESPDTAFWSRLAKKLPVDVRAVSPRGAEDAVSQIEAIVDARIDTEDDTAPAVFLLVYNLSRFRTLKKSDDDFGFSGLGGDSPPSPAVRLAKIVRDGPAVGVHSIIWCDTYNNTTRWLDRQTLFDLNLRVLFQMSATDSSNLMDSPEASHLGVHRAVFYSDEQGVAERFRPYRRPTREWIKQVQQYLSRRFHGLAETSTDDDPLETDQHGRPIK